MGFVFTRVKRGQFLLGSESHDALIGRMFNLTAGYMQIVMLFQKSCRLGLPCVDVGGISPSGTLKRRLEFCLGVANCQGLFQLLPPLLNLAVEIAADGLLGPGLVVERRPALLLWVPHHICH